MKLGLYGGAFNPIHRCHLLVAKTVRDWLGLDTVLFIPIGDPPHKPPSDFIPAKHRLEMVNLAITPYPYFQLSDIETRRKAKSYTIDTVLALKETYPPDTQLIFIIGLDAFHELPSWREPERLLESCDFAVVSRAGSQFKSLEKLPILGITDPDQLAQLDAGQLKKYEFRLKRGRSLWALAIPPCEVSSQEVRRRLKSKQSIENLLPTAVESYILRYHSGAGGLLQ
ncbi:MAG TPA: nicotinate-nucleotide adenylyltransferase [Nitrospirales bacterium]|jgi:nicotinate-nucleotide adenylyltransferase|nr:nicotinate-nucleotide adenylyltransferase [Nitrospirales bacterium]